MKYTQKMGMRLDKERENVVKEKMRIRNVGMEGVWRNMGLGV